MEANSQASDFHQDREGALKDWGDVVLDICFGDQSSRWLNIWGLELERRIYNWLREGVLILERQCQSCEEPQH